jgi:hypothetical protein
MPTVIHLGKNDFARFLVVIPDRKITAVYNCQCQIWLEQMVANKKLNRNLTVWGNPVFAKAVE